VADAAVSRFHRAPVLRARQPATRRSLWLLWLVFLGGVIAAVLSGAEVGLRVRRELIAARLTTPPLEDSRFVADRLVRYTNRPGYAYESQNQAGVVLHYTNNSLGFRGPEVSRAKPPGIKRVILVGGSTVYGALVDDPDTIGIQLETILRQRLGPDIEVINAGVPGYQALQELVFTRSDLYDLQPDVLVDLDGLNDVFYGSLAEWPAQVAADELGIIADGRFRDVVTMVDSTMFPNGLVEHQLTMLARTLHRTWSSAIYHHPPVEPRTANQRVVALHAGSLGLLARSGREAGISMIAGLQPLLATGHKQLTADEQAAVVREGYWSGGGWQEIALDMYPRVAGTTRDAVVAEGGTFLDMSGVFDEEMGSTYAEDAVHYTALGNRSLAQALAPLIEERIGPRPKTP
jgi:hypothetical protein